MTVAGALLRRLDAVGEGLVDAGPGGRRAGRLRLGRAADVVGDTFRLRERNFGRVHDAEGPVLSPDEPAR